MREMSMQPGQRLRNDLRRVVSDAEALLVATASSAGDEIRELRFRLQSTLSQTRHHLRDAQDTVVDKARSAAWATDDYVHDHPWRVIGTAAVTAMMLGLLLGRR